jgi:CSLREA domain-containing protein
MFGRGMTNARRLSATTTAVLAATLVFAGGAQAAAFAVTKTADTVPDGCTPSDCSLREAVQAANASPGNVVSIPAGTFVLNTAENVAAFGELDIEQDMTISGAGARNTIVSGNGRSRVFHVTDSDITATLNDLTITGGHTPVVDPPGGYSEESGHGGGIYSSGTVNLNRVSVRGNTASIAGGGIYNNLPEFSALSSVNLNIDRSTISGNSVSAGTVIGYGGGISAVGNLTMTNSTVAGNTMNNEPGNEGGGIVSMIDPDADEGDFGLISLTNVTVAGNSIAGDTPGANSGGGLSGQIFTPILLRPLYANLAARNTIIANNSVNGATQDCAFVNTTSSTNNISRDGSCGFTDPGSKQATDPGLLGLENRGGPTDTMGLTPTSAATNTGTNSGCPTIDQRGVARPQAGTCDVGALELALPSAITGDAKDVKVSSATITGLAGNPHVDPGTTFFQFGTSTAYGQTTPAQPVAALSRKSRAKARASVAASYSASLRGLKAGRVYHYRIGATNRDGTSLGLDRTFRVLSKPKLTLAGIPRSCVRSAFRLRVRAKVAKGTHVRSVRVRVDGRLVKRTSRSRFTLRIKPGKRGRHRIEVRVTDRRGGTRVVRRAFTRCAARVVPHFTG